MRMKLLSTAVMIACATAATAAAADDAQSTTIGGKAYFDFTNVDQKNDGVKQDNSGTGFDIKRFYISVDHKFDDMWSANLTTDVTYNQSTDTNTVYDPVSGTSTTTTKTNGMQLDVYVKKAYVQAAFDKAFVLRAGSADLPWIPFVENLYGYRFVENTLIDHAKFGTSADWGLHAKGDIGMLSYALSAVNGAGYKHPSRSKSMDVEGRVSIMPVEGLTFGAGFYNGKLGKETQSVTTDHTAERFDLVAAYVNSMFRVGAEWFQAKNWNQVTSTATDKSDGYSVWASYNFTQDWAVFTRYDEVKPSKDLATDVKNKYFNIGLNYQPRKNIDIAFAFKQDKIEGNTNGMKFANSNMAFSGLNEGKYNEFGVWTQVKF